MKKLTKPATAIQSRIQAASGANGANHPLSNSNLRRNTRHNSSMCSTDCQQQESETLRKLWRSVEQSADSLAIMDRQGVMEYVNPAFQALTGYTQQEAIGQSHEILKSDQQPQELYDQIWETVLAGDVFRGVVMDRKKNGET